MSIRTANIHHKDEINEEAANLKAMFSDAYHRARVSMSYRLNTMSIHITQCGIGLGLKVLPKQVEILVQDQLVQVISMDTTIQTQPQIQITQPTVITPIININQLQRAMPVIILIQLMKMKILIILIIDVQEIQIIMI